ncbi:MAG TPA: hypothetical protein V6C96_01530 [Vampirovibrionales bacterium]
MQLLKQASNFFLGTNFELDSGIRSVSTSGERTQVDTIIPYDSLNKSFIGTSSSSNPFMVNEPTTVSQLDPLNQKISSVYDFQLASILEQYNQRQMAFDQRTLNGGPADESAQLLQQLDEVSRQRADDLLQARLKSSELEWKKIQMDMEAYSKILNG